MTVLNFYCQGESAHKAAYRPFSLFQFFPQMFSISEEVALKQSNNLGPDASGAVATMDSAPDMDGLIKGCYCGDILDDEEKTFVYVEGTKLDRSVAEDDSALSDAVWRDMRPPKLFAIDYFPVVTARQVQIQRIQLQGKRKLAGEDEGVAAAEKVNVSISKKKCAFQYLSNTSLVSIECCKPVKAMNRFAVYRQLNWSNNFQFKSTYIEPSSEEAESSSSSSSPPPPSEESAVAFLTSDAKDRIAVCTIVGRRTSSLKAPIEPSSEEAESSSSSSPPPPSEESAPASLTSDAKDRIAVCTIGVGRISSSLIALLEESESASSLAEESEPVSALSEESEPASALSEESEPASIHRFNAVRLSLDVSGPGANGATVTATAGPDVTETATAGSDATVTATAGPDVTETATAGSDATQTATAGSEATATATAGAHVAVTSKGIEGIAIGKHKHGVYSTDSNKNIHYSVAKNLLQLNIRGLVGEQHQVAAAGQLPLLVLVVRLERSQKPGKGPPKIILNLQSHLEHPYCLIQACMWPPIISRSVDRLKAEGPLTKIPEGPGLSPPMVWSWRNPPASIMSSVMDRFLDRRCCCMVGFKPGPRAMW
ncbi:hypothetical protein HUJ04_011936 [Dendroctonus ponderosae]|nr:hypothetical protein HUJ04_011936 [Dendroctonus ponderosae]